MEDALEVKQYYKEQCELFRLDEKTLQPIENGAGLLRVWFALKAQLINLKSHHRNKLAQTDRIWKSRKQMANKKVAVFAIYSSRTAVEQEAIAVGENAYSRAKNT